MLKLSKTDVVKIAEEKEEDKQVHPDSAADDVQGSEVEDDADDMDEELTEEGAADEDGDEAEKELEDAKSPKFDARREAATPHAHAVKDLFTKRRALQEQVNMLNDEIFKHRDVLQALDPKMKHEAYADDKELRNFLRPEKVKEEKKKKKKKAEQEAVENLLKIAEFLDYAGQPEGVSLVENILYIFANKDEGMPKYDLETVEKTERKYPDIATGAPTMSTRNCPDHYGAQMQRVAEGTFQCELDGRMYNWNQGFKDYNGNVYPGAPIRSVDFPDTTERMFETRQMATSKRTK